MKRFRSVWDTSGISGNGVIFRAAAYCVLFAIILRCGCSDNGIGTAVGEGKIPPIPSAASNVKAKAMSSSSITVSWLSVSQATGYNVYRSTSTDGGYSKVGGTTSTSYTDTRLSSGTSYYYKVSAYNRGGESSLSSYISVPTLPAVPSDVSATATTPGNITVSWSPVFGATGYNVYRGMSCDGANSPVGTTSSASYTNTGLLSSTTYYYKVSAYNSSGEDSLSPCVSATTVITDVPIVSATATSSSSITVSWSSVSGALGYYVYRDTSPDGTYSKVGTVSSASTSYTNTGLLSGTTYYYKVSAYNSTGEGSLSPYAFATTPLNPPSGVYAKAESKSGITVSWSSVSQATGYNVYRSTSANGPYNVVGTTSSTSYTNTGLSPCITYYYKVSAYNDNSDVESAMSSYTEATTLSDLPSVSAITESSSSITVSWSSVCGAEGYYVYRATSASDNYSQVRTTSSTSYTDVGLPSGTTYCYKVSAYNNSVGEFSLSAYTCATTVQVYIPSTFTDYRDGKTYNTMETSDNKVWMAENLNYETGDSWCYDNSQYECDTYGRLYTWVAAMDIDAYYYSVPWNDDTYHQGICPDGWHLPSRREWGDLAIAAGGTGTYGSGGSAGTKLKSNTGWNSSSAGTDNYKFSALPGGYSDYFGGGFFNAGTIGYWWTASEDYSGNAYYRSMRYNGANVGEDVNDKTIGMSVRCVKD